MSLCIVTARTPSGLALLGLALCNCGTASTPNQAAEGVGATSGIAGGGRSGASASEEAAGTAGGNAVAGDGSLGGSGRSPLGGSGGLGAQAGTSGQGGGSAGQAGAAGAACGTPNSPERLIAFGTTLEAQAQMCESRALAQSLADPSSTQWQAKGDQKRTYRFKAANADVAYRLVVPTTWDGKAELPLVVFLHGAGSDESTYLDQNNKQLVGLAQQRGYVLVSPLGYQGAYGNFLRLPAVFGQPAEAAIKIAAITPDSEKTNELSEKDVINVVELVLNEYPIDRAAMFLTGHSMGSGGTWYLGAKYGAYWAALAPMSGPFVQETGYPWETVGQMPIFVTEGTQAASVAGSHALRDWMMSKAYEVQYQEVNADHPGMVPLVLPDVFTFFDRVRMP